MDSKLAQQLDSLLSADLHDKDAAAKAAEEKVNRDALNLVDFDRKKETVIKPALNEIVAVYKSKGIFCRLIDRMEQSRPGGLETPQIGLDLAGA